MTAEPLRGCEQPLVCIYDVALLDLDGVVYRGGEAIPKAAEAIAQAREAGMRIAFMTNNALRPPQAVVERLNEAGVEASLEEVVTSAQAAARVLAERLEPGSRVLVCGGAGLREAVEEAGLVAVAEADDDPVAVVSGFDPEMTYPRLAEAVLAVRRGLPWVASNTDTTMPTERGQLPGAGALVAFVATASDREPEVIGKPERTLYEEAAHRRDAERPLAVGDRLDTDIEGAVRSGIDSLLVLTGVTDVSELIRADAERRPSYLGADLAALHVPHPAVHCDEEELVASCGRWECRLVDKRLRWSERDGEEHDERPDEERRLDALRAAVAVCWSARDQGVEWDGVDGAAPVEGFED